MDWFLKKVFEPERWEAALEKGIIKGIDKADLRALTSPEVRANLYLCIKNGTYKIAPSHMAQIPKDEYEIVTETKSTLKYSGTDDLFVYDDMEEIAKFIFMHTYSHFEDCNEEDFMCPLFPTDEMDVFAYFHGGYVNTFPWLACKCKAFRPNTIDECVDYIHEWFDLYEEECPEFVLFESEKDKELYKKEHSIVEKEIVTKQVPKFRTVYVNENLDRIFLSIVNDLCFEKFPNWIHPACKSYQKGIGCGKVVEEAVQTIAKVDDNTIGFKADLSKYFDSVCIDKIDQVLNFLSEATDGSAVIDILKAYYHQDICFDLDGNVVEQYQSLKQGCAFASFLADVVLHDVDEALSDIARREGGFYCRYSDDILYIGESYEYAMKLLSNLLEMYSLTLNPKKVEVLTKDKWFKFLGFSIKGDMITLSKSRLKSFQKEIEKRTIRKVHSNHKLPSYDGCVNRVMDYLYNGDKEGHSWATNVLPIINVAQDINEMNKFVMDCLRAVQTGRCHLGGLGYDILGENGTVLRGKGKNVRTNRNRTDPHLDGYITLTTAKNALMSNRDAFDALVRTATI